MRSGPPPDLAPHTIWMMLFVLAGATICTPASKPAVTPAVATLNPSPT
jgi:hypothetical protein